MLKCCYLLFRTFSALYRWLSLRSCTPVQVPLHSQTIISPCFPKIPKQSPNWTPVGIRQPPVQAKTPGRITWRQGPEERQQQSMNKTDKREKN